MTILEPSNEIHLSHEEYVGAYHGHEITVFVNHPAICGLCDSVLAYASAGNGAYRSAKLWFWLLPVLSLLSFFVLGPLALIVLIISIGVSIFKIGADVREKAYACIVEATLVDSGVYESLREQNFLRINQRQPK